MVDTKEVKEEDKFDGLKAGWGTFIRKIELYVLGDSVQQSLMKGEQIEMTDDDDPELFKHLFKKQLLKIVGQTPAVQDRHNTIPVFRSWLEISQQDFFKWLMTHTRDATLSVVTFSWESVEKTVPEIRRLHGADKSHTTSEVEQALANGWYWMVPGQDYAKAVFSLNDCIKTLKPNTSMVMYFRSIEAL